MGAAWFTDISYLHNNGEITLKLNVSTLEKLVAFIKYTNVSFEHITKIQNNYSIYTYLTLKILKDASKKTNIILTVSEFKEKLGIGKKYSQTRDLKIRVLEVIKKEINEYTDLNLDYCLTKEGRSFTKVKFIFDYKNKYLEQKKTKKLVNKPESFDISEENMTDVYSSDSAFETILVGWGLRAIKVVEIQGKHSILFRHFRK